MIQTLHPFLKKKLLRGETHALANQQTARLDSFSVLVDAHKVKNEIQNQGYHRNMVRRKALTMKIIKYNMSLNCCLISYVRNANETVHSFLRENTYASTITYGKH